MYWWFCKNKNLILPTLVPFPGCASLSADNLVYYLKSQKELEQNFYVLLWPNLPSAAFVPMPSACLLILWQNDPRADLWPSPLVYSRTSFPKLPPLYELLFFPLYFISLIKIIVCCNMSLIVLKKKISIQLLPNFLVLFYSKITLKNCLHSARTSTPPILSWTNFNQALPLTTPLTLLSSRPLVASTLPNPMAHSQSSFFDLPVALVGDSFLKYFVHLTSRMLSQLLSSFTGYYFSNIRWSFSIFPNSNTGAPQGLVLSVHLYLYSYPLWPCPAPGFWM